MAALPAGQHCGANFALAQQQQMVEQQQQLQQLTLMLQQTAAQPSGASTLPASDRVDRLFVSKVPTELTQEDIRLHFAKYGDLTDVYLPLAPGTVSHKGIGFVSFANPMDLHKAMAAKPHEIRGIPIAVDLAAPRSAPATSGQGQGSTNNGSRLFLTKVTPEINKFDLQSYFSQFGDITDCYVPPGNKGIAFVSFSQPQMAQRVLQNATHQVKPGHTIVVSQAFDRPPAKGGGKGGAAIPWPQPMPPSSSAGGGGCGASSFGIGSGAGLGAAAGGTAPSSDLAALALLAVAGSGLDLGPLLQAFQLQQLLQQQQHNPLASLLGAFGSSDGGCGADSGALAALAALGGGLGAFGGSDAASAGSLDTSGALAALAALGCAGGLHGSSADVAGTSPGFFGDGSAALGLPGQGGWSGGYDASRPTWSAHRDGPY